MGPAGAAIGAGLRTSKPEGVVRLIGSVTVPRSAEALAAGFVGSKLFSQLAAGVTAGVLITCSFYHRLIASNRKPRILYGRNTHAKQPVAFMVQENRAQNPGVYLSRPTPQGGTPYDAYAFRCSPLRDRDPGRLFWQNGTVESHTNAFKRRDRSRRSHVRARQGRARSPHQDSARREESSLHFARDARHFGRHHRADERQTERRAHRKFEGLQKLADERRMYAYGSGFNPVPVEGRTVTPAR